MAPQKRKWRLEIHGHVSIEWLGLNSSQFSLWNLCPSALLEISHAKRSTRLYLTARKTSTCVAGIDLDLSDILPPKFQFLFMM